MFTAQSWRDFYKSPGAIAVCASPSWLLGGCPVCGGKTWQVTNDCWAYCDRCSKGYPTMYSFTRRPLAYLDATGEHCFLCRGTGKLQSGEVCDECGGENA